MSKSVVKYSDVDVAKIQVEEPVEKTIPNSVPPTKYKELPILYNYGTPEEPRYGGFFIQSPPVLCRGGIRKTEEMDKKTNKGTGKYFYTMGLVIDQAVPETRAYGEMLEKNFFQYCGWLQHWGKTQKKMGLEWQRFDAAAHLAVFPYAKQFKSHLYIPFDKLTGEKLPGKNPGYYVKLNDGKFGRTKFLMKKKDGTSAEIPWSSLESRDFTCVVITNDKKIYNGNNTSLQNFVDMVLILKLEEAQSIDKFSIDDGMASQYSDDIEETLFGKKKEVFAPIPEMTEDTRTMNQILSSMPDIPAESHIM